MELSAQQEREEGEKKPPLSLSPVCVLANKSQLLRLEVPFVETLGRVCSRSKSGNGHFFLSFLIAGK